MDVRNRKDDSAQDRHRAVELASFIQRFCAHRISRKHGLLRLQNSVA